MKLLPSREEEFVDLYFFQRVTQVEIAERHDVGLPVVGYRLLRAQERIVHEVSQASARFRRRLALWSAVFLLLGALCWGLMS